jgi:hypothetical protein
MTKILKNLILIPIILSYSFLYGQMPKDLKECNEYFNSNLKQDEIEHIRFLTLDQLSELHFTLGLFIRNNWIHGNRNPELINYFQTKDLYHPDDISSVIIKSYWHYLNNKEFNLNTEIEFYQEYWEKAIELEKKDIENRTNAETKFNSAFKDIIYNNIEVPKFVIPNRKTDNGVFSNEFIRFQNGYIINSLTTSPEGGGEIGISYKYYYIDLETNNLKELLFNDFDTVESLTTIDSILFVTGKSNNKIRIIKYVDGNKTNINTTIKNSEINEFSNESWTKLGVFENKLFAFQKNGLYYFNDTNWQIKKKFDLTDLDLIIPTENFKLCNNQVYFLQEVLQSRDCELYILDLNTNLLEEFWDKNEIINDYKKEINNYTFYNDTLYVSAQQMDENILLSYYNNDLTLYILDNRLKLYKSGSYLIKPGTIIENSERKIIIARNGMYELTNSIINPLAYFENTEQKFIHDGYNFQFNFEPRSCVFISKNKYLIGGMFDGLYLVDLDSKAITCLDDKDQIEKMYY